MNLLKKVNGNLVGLIKKIMNNTKKMLALLNEIKIDDVVILKSTYTRTHELPFENNNGKSVSVMKLKKLGHVK